MDQPAAVPDAAPLTFEGKTVERVETGFLIEGQTFPTLEDAKSFVLSLPSAPLEEAVIVTADSDTKGPTALGYADLAEPEIHEADEVLAAPEPEEVLEPDQASVITALIATDTNTHSGTTIDHVEGGYRIDSDFFDSLDDAKQAIENPNLRPLLTRKYPV
jgi:hypothetical protein